MKKLCVLLLVLACVIGCTGCICSHSWVEADCLNPKTCPLCGKSEGQAIGHLWEDATCMAPRTCKLCGLTEGEPVSHSWIEASCAAPRTCQWCALTEGDVLPHSWQNATTEAPRTCSGCGLTEGDPIITDERFTTAANAFLFGVWQAETVMPGADLNLEEYMAQVPVVITLTFAEDGTMEKRYTVKDLDAFMAELIGITAERLYVQFEDMDISREDADEMFEGAYDMSISEYAASFWADADLNGMLAVHNTLGVYYATETAINMAGSWESEFQTHRFALDGEQLTVTAPDGTAMTLTRSAETAQ